MSEVIVMRGGKQAKRYTRDGTRFYYTDEGNEYPSVTSILSVLDKPALRNWIANTEREMVITAAANLYEDLPTTGQKMSRAGYLATIKNRIGQTKAYQKELAAAQEVGSAVHALIEWNIRKELGQIVGPQPEVSNKILHAFAAYEDWRARVKFKPLAIEQTVWSDIHAYAGTMDLWAEVDGEECVLDFKTGKAVYKEAKVQIAAYAFALSEMGHGHPKAGIVLRLPKIEADPNFEAVRVDNLERYFKAFLAIRQAWEWCALEDSAERAAYKAKVAAEKAAIKPAV